MDPKTQAETWVRRYREGYVEVPRKNAKSTLSSGLALYMLSADGEHGAEVYSAATTRDQARIVFDDSRAMAERVSDLRTYLGVAFMQHSITVAHTASKYTPLAAEGSTLDGLNVHFAVIDELHAHKTRAVYDVIDSARGSREQSLLWNITTAGTDIGGICYERRTHTVKVLEHVIDDPALSGSSTPSTQLTILTRQAAGPRPIRTTGTQCLRTTWRQLPARPRLCPARSTTS